MMPRQQVDKLTSEINTLVSQNDWQEIFRRIDEEELSVDFIVSSHPEGTLFQKALATGNIKLVEAFEARGATIGSVTDGVLDIEFAAKGGGVWTLEWLRARGQDVTASGKSGKNLVHIAVDNSTSKVAYDPSQLMDYAHSVGTPIDARQDNGNTALSTLCINSITSRSKPLYYKLAEYGADLNVPIKDAKLKPSEIFPDGLPLMLEVLKTKKPGQAAILYDLGAELGSDEQQEEFLRLLPESSDSEKKTKEEITQYLEAYRALPSVDATNPIKKADLFELSEEGLAPLDNPKTWQQLPQILEALDKQGEPLTLRELMRENHEGKPWLQRAVECRATQPLLTHLREQGQWPEASLFAGTGENGLNSLGQALLDCAATEHFFQASHWKDRGTGALTDFHKALPQALQSQVRNMKQLHIEIERAQAAPQRSRA